MPSPPGVVFVLDRATFRRVLKASAEQSLIVSSRLLRTCLESTPALLERLSEEQVAITPLPPIPILPPHTLLTYS